MESTRDPLAHILGGLSSIPALGSTPSPELCWHPISSQQTAALLQCPLQIIAFKHVCFGVYSANVTLRVGGRPAGSYRSAFLLPGNISKGSPICPHLPTASILPWDARTHLLQTGQGREERKESVKIPHFSLIFLSFNYRQAHNPSLPATRLGAAAMHEDSPCCGDGAAHPMCSHRKNPTWMPVAWQRAEQGRGTRGDHGRSWDVQTESRRFSDDPPYDFRAVEKEARCF